MSDIEDEDICFLCHNWNAPEEGEHDIKQLAIEVVNRLPKDVRDWLLVETRHIFICGSGQLGQFDEVLLPPPREEHGGLLVVRIIYLSEQLRKESKERAMFTIVHEIAHSRCGHQIGDGVTERDCEDQADALASSWGFAIPDDRHDLSQYDA
jgi:hypothetical protein